MTQEQTICPECAEDVELCILCGEIIHDDDWRALMSEGTYCQMCYKRKFREGCTNKKMTDEVEGYPV